MEQRYGISTNTWKCTNTKWISRCSNWNEQTGNVIVLDRVNGEPIFDTRYRLGEGKLTSNKYFLDLVKPEPLEKSEFLDTDIFDVLKKIVYQT